MPRGVVPRPASGGRDASVLSPALAGLLPADEARGGPAALALALLATVAAAQGPAPAAQGSPPGSVADPRRAVVERILEEALVRGEAFAKLQALCTAAPHRLSGSAGADAAVQWARAEMEKDGLANVRLEPCTVPRWKRGIVARLAVVEPAAAQTTFLPVLALGGSVATPRGGVEGELLRVQGLDELHALGAAARGRIVLFDRPMAAGLADPFEAYGRAVDQRSRGAAEAARAGAVAAIVRSMTLRLDDQPHTGALRYEEGVPPIPAAAVSTAGAERLAALLRDQRRVRVRLELDCQTLEDVPSANVVGEIPGAPGPGGPGNPGEASEIVLLGAHLDAWDVGHGAHDDGAGCAQVLEALRLLRALRLQPRRTVRAVLFMNEENGLRGALAYREAHRAELGVHVLALEADRGGFSPRGFGVGASDEAFAALRPLVTLLEGTGATTLVRSGGGADVSVLARDGVIVMELLTDPNRYFDVHHSARDTLDTVHPRELELGAAALAAFAWAAADAEERLPPGARR